ncbi:TPA: hypothetical protein N0F65_012823, partial [Lagenidium giganteum]
TSSSVMSKDEHGTEGDGAKTQGVQRPRVQVTSLDVKRWRFSCTHAPALNSDEREQLSEKLGLPSVVSLPEVVFGHSKLCVEYAARNLVLTFSADEGLKNWLEIHQTSMYKWWLRLTGIRPISTSPTEETNERIPLDKLKQQVEILYYDHVILYEGAFELVHPKTINGPVNLIFPAEDDIRDLGEIYLEAKIRVMEFGFLILCRYYCRVDTKNVRLVDTRYYHEFGDDVMFRDHEIREANMALLRQVCCYFKTNLPHLHIDHVPAQRLYPSFSNDINASQEAPNDFGADIVYQALAPKSTKTHKIYLN